ncbi:MAG: hypothetical protein ACRDHP_05240, partial [Ktedonobacterales bacterium]
VEKLPEPPEESDAELLEIAPLPSASRLPRLPLPHHSRRMLSGVASVAAALVLILLASLVFINRPRTGGDSAGQTVTQTNLSSVSMVSPGEGWVAGNSVTFSIQARPTATVAHSGWFSYAPLTGYHVVSDRMLLYHYQNGTWTPVHVNVSGGGAQLNAISMDSRTDGWAAGSLLLHFDGTTWRQQTLPVRGMLTEVRMVAPNDGWALGVREGSAPHTPFILHYDGTAWTEQALPAGLGADAQHIISVRNLVALPTGDAWILVTRFPVGTTVTDNPGNPGSGSTTSTSGSGMSPRDVLPSTAILHSTGGPWTVQATLPGMVVNSFDMATPHDGWAVANDAGLPPVASPPLGVHSSPLFLRYAGGAWTPVTMKAVGDTVHQLNISRLDLLSPAEGWAVGISQTNTSGMTIVNGTPQPTPSPVPGPQMSLALAHYDGATWSATVGPGIPNGMVAVVSGADFAASGDGWVTGTMYTLPEHAGQPGGAQPIITQTEPLLLHYTHGAWSSVPLPA